MEGNKSKNADASSGRPPEAIKNAHLPRLARSQQQQQGSDDTSVESGGPSRLTLSERMTRMRIEDRRRERNKDRANQEQRQRVLMQGDHTAFSTPSASARAGTLYHQSSQLAQDDVTQRRAANALRNKFAGPAPPSSWRSEQTPTSSSSSLQNGERVSESIDMTKRRRSTAALRLFVDGEVATGAADVSSLISLRDACLVRIAERCRSRDSKDTEDSLLTIESISLLPTHLKERFMALAGREQRCEGLNGISSSLLFDSYRASDSSSGSATKASIIERQSDWDVEEEEEERDGYTVVDSVEEKIGHARTINVDLSYASIEHKRLRSILTQRIDVNHLRMLSLAGWGQQKQQKSLSSLHDLMEMIGNLVHLETLSLANSRLSFSGSNTCQGGDGIYIATQQQSKESKMLESMTILKRLSRASLRLKVLDLSECDWIVGPDVANLGWYSIEKTAIRSKIIWPRLQHLILHNCPAFIEPNTERNVVVQRSPSFVARWHAAHHGVTDSPYLSDHRPGLGRALFQTSDPHAERRERQARLRRSLRTDRGGGEATTRRRKNANGEDEIDDVWGPSPLPSSLPQGIAEGNNRDAPPPPPPPPPTTTTFQSSSSSAFPTRCPVSGVHVRSWEWERARVLDAIRGRWGSAINGNDALHLTGVFIEVYF